MDQQEWMGYVSRLANGEYPVPVGMIQDYNDWRCRSIVGRAAALLWGARCTGWATLKARCVF